MFNKNPRVAEARPPPIFTKSPSNIEKHESLIWTEKERTLHMLICYNDGSTQEETAAYMAILIDRMVEYGPWAVNLQLLLRPRLIRPCENPSIYSQQVCEMRDLVNHINQYFKILTQVVVQVKVDYPNFHQMKLAASLFALETYWTLAYYVDGTTYFLRIDGQSHLMRRLHGVYERDFKV